MPSTTMAHPPIQPLTHSTLMHFTAWIRDTLDPLIARHGPTMLTPDDTLILHDFFTALLFNCNSKPCETPSSTSAESKGTPYPSLPLTILDLRTTRVHRAVIEVCGLATRWPAWLVDLCDKLMHLWTLKHGDLARLRPFLCGRGGRLEGIWRGEGSRARLVERWRMKCPERVSGARAWRRGACGFKAGDWWINTLFAAHAGIIDLATASASKSSICHNGHAAYALLLKDSAEVESCSENAFTFRCAQSDIGRYKLTAATRRSREPVRVLRSHAGGSIWGPRAGVRYEGLYKVSSWSIRQAQHKEIISGDLRTGDVVYEVRFERIDEVPMDEVMRRPFAAELDDYAEYQRVKKEGREHRRGRRKSEGNRRWVRTAVPPTTSTITTTTIPLPTTGKALESPGLTQIVHYALTTKVEDPSESNTALRSRKPTMSNTSSLHTVTGYPSDMREVAPWLDYDHVLAKPSPKSGSKNEDRKASAVVKRESTSIAARLVLRALDKKGMKNQSSEGVTNRRSRQLGALLDGEDEYGISLVSPEMNATPALGMRYAEPQFDTRDPVSTTSSSPTKPKPYPATHLGKTPSAVLGQAISRSSTMMFKHNEMPTSMPNVYFSGHCSVSKTLPAHSKHSLPGSLSRFISPPKSVVPISSTTSTSVFGHVVLGRKRSQEALVAVRLKGSFRKRLGREGDSGTVGERESRG